MRRKDVKHLSLKQLIVLGAISFSLPAFISVPVSAAEAASTVTLEDIEQKRKNIEDAQRRYDMALAGQHAAEDLVENARRARDDAQEQYDLIMEKYKKGFAGFLQWVIDTEDDPLKVEDAQSTLALLKENGETDEISPASTRNITRMYFTAQWLEEYADFLERYEDMGVNGTTSHLWMYHTQDISNDYSDFLDQNEDSYLTGYKSHRWKYNNEYHDEYELYGEGSWRDLASSYFWLYYSMNSNNNNISSDEAGTLLAMPFEERSLGTLAEDQDGVPVLEHSQNEYKRTDTDPYGNWWGEWFYWPAQGEKSDDGYNYIIGLCTLADPGSGENLSIDYLYFGDNRMPYTLREYAQALRDYYALVDPLPFKAAWDDFEDDYTNAKKELKGAEDLVSSEFSRLKGAQKDYDEAVALYGVNNALPEQTAADPFVFLTSEITDEEPMYAGEELIEASVMATENTSLSETASDTEDKTYNENATVSVSSDLTSATEKEEIRSAGSGYVQPASAAAAFTYTDTVSEEESTKKPAEEQNGILMRVMSYIFNGGAIAVIIPAGFRRRKKTLGSTPFLSKAGSVFKTG